MTVSYGGKMNASTIDFRDVLGAAERLHGQAVRTPLLRSDALDAATGGHLWLKPESLQRTGSFKFRGAYNRLAALSPAERAAGVVAFSSGNHAQGVAAAAQVLGMQATIVMPSDAPKLKVENTKGFGADVVLYDRATESREAIAAAIAADRGGTVVPSFDDPYIIAGQGTAGLEMAQDCQALGIAPDLFLCCTGGGGLVAGCTVALREQFPSIGIRTVEPTDYDDAARSLAGGRRVGIAGYPTTVCDALQTPMVGALTFPILQAAGAQGVGVSDAQALAAMAFAFRHLKLVLEPGGAVALAAALSGTVALQGKTALIMLSGGNVDAATFERCLAPV
jgi:threonine dehydratase